MISHRFAIAADIDRYYGERPAKSIKAIVILMDDEPAAVIGLECLPDRYIAFSEFKPALEPHLKSMAVLRAVKAAQDMIHTASMPVLVVNTTNLPLIERLGFLKIAEGVHLCPH